MLKYVRIILIALFILALAGAGWLYFYSYTHTDNTPPEFQADAELVELSVSDPDEALLEGVHAYDNRDGDITGKIRIKNISALTNKTDVEVTYIVFDAASNYATYTRTARYTDYASPRFKLTKPMVFSVGQTVSFRDSVIVKDLREGDISARLKLEETTVMSNTPGTYTAKLSVTNRMGDTIYLPLTVQIIDKSVSRPTINLREYLIYLERGKTINPRRYLKTLYDPMAENPNQTASIYKVTINDSQLDSSTPGVYEIYYYYTGLSGEIATAILTVIVN